MTPEERAIRKIAGTLGTHRRVPRGEGKAFSTCSNRLCNGTVFLNLNDHYEHQAVMAMRSLRQALDYALEDAADDARDRGEQPDPVLLAEIRSELLVLAEASSPDTEAHLAAARVGALEAAAEEARIRGDVGKEGGVDVWDFLEHRAEQARQASQRLDVVDPTDPRVASAANAYRKAMAEMGQKTSVAQAAVAIRAALAAADRAGAS